MIFLFDEFLAYWGLFWSTSSPRQLEKCVIPSERHWNYPSISMLDWMLSLCLSIAFHTLRDCHHWPPCSIWETWWDSNGSTTIAENLWQPKDQCLRSSNQIHFKFASQPGTELVTDWLDSLVFNEEGNDLAGWIANRIFMSTNARSFMVLLKRYS